MLIFEVGSAICGAAPTVNAEIVGRAICGVGGIGIYMGALNLLAATTTSAERPVYISLMGICWGLGTVLGPIIGGAFADSSATWRWSFYINLVIGAVVAPAYILLLPSTNENLRGTRLTTRICTLDWVGTVLVSGAVVSGIMAINFGGLLFAWSSATIIGLFVCSGILFIFFGIQQAWSILTTPEDRIFPCDIVLNCEADVLFAQTAAGLGASLVVIYFIPVSTCSNQLRKLSYTDPPALLSIHPARKDSRSWRSTPSNDVHNDLSEYIHRNLTGSRSLVRPFRFDWWRACADWRYAHVFSRRR